MILCDEDHILGGRLNGDRREICGMSGSVLGCSRSRLSSSHCRNCASCAERRCSVRMTEAPMAP